MLDWTNPGHVGSLTEWKNKVARPLRLGQSHDANNKQLSLARVPPPKPTIKNDFRKSHFNLKRIFFLIFSSAGILQSIRCLFRTKALIADQLPTKTDKVVFCPLTETQRIAYESLMECEDIELIKRRGEPCECESGLRRGNCCYPTNAEGKRIDELIFPYIYLFLR